MSYSIPENMIENTNYTPGVLTTYAALNHNESDEPISFVELAKQAHVSRRSVTTFIGILEEDSWVRVSRGLRGRDTNMYKILK